ncbi:hypothetical protein Pelo_15654 [Pelomyxa schiedti]|nr:hypothetical protein Pelo_15654 [Pelomyxa schiedti]
MPDHSGARRRKKHKQQQHKEEDHNDKGGKKQRSPSSSSQHAAVLADQLPPCCAASVTQMATACLGAWGDGDTGKAYLLSLQLILGGARCDKHQHLRGKCSQQSVADQQREVYRRQVGLSREHKAQSKAAALASLVWTFLVMTEPKLLEPLWPLDLGVTDTQPEEEQMATSKCKLNTVAHLLLGVALSEEYGRWQFTDEAKSLKHLKIAADRGQPFAQLFLCYTHGFGYLEYLKKSASQGFGPALHSLGCMYMKDTDYQTGSWDDVPLNREEGLRLFQIGAEKGDAECMFKLYMNASKREEGISWLKLACDQGWPKAQYEMALALGSRLGTRVWGLEVNNQEALRLLELSASQGDTDSQTLLGTIFLKRGGLVKQNFEKAIDK